MPQIYPMSWMYPYMILLFILMIYNTYMYFFFINMSFYNNYTSMSKYMNMKW